MTCKCGHDKKVHKSYYCNCGSTHIFCMDCPDDDTCYCNEDVYSIA